MMKTAIIPCLMLVCSMALSGCLTGNQPDYALLADREQARVKQWAALEDETPLTILGHLIESTELDALVEEALAANPSLRQVLLTLKIRQAEYRQTQGEKWPSLDAGFEGTKEKDGGNETFTGSLTVSWELDLWQKLESGSQAASKDVAQQKMLYQAARDTLAADVMSNWLGLTAALKNIDIEQQRLDSLEKTETFIVERYKNGLGSLEELDNARSATAASKAAVESYRETLSRGMRALGTLVGKNGTLIKVPEDYQKVLVPLTGLPEQTLQRRPDLKAAFLAIEAAGLRSDVAYKALLPSISLQAALTDAAASPASALLSSPAWSLLGQLTAPLFRGGKLKAAADIADLKYAQCFEAYRETLHNAVREIEDAIGLERSLSRQQGFIESALENSENSLGHYARSYRQGLTDILDLLTVQRQTYDLKIQLNTLIHERLANRVTLGLALGLGVK